MTLSENAARPDFAHISVRPVAGALGAEVTGCSLAGGVDSETATEIRQALLDHLVLFFPDQELTPTQLLAFAAGLGRPLQYPQVRGLPEAPMVTEVAKLEHERVNFGGVWHTDTSYLERPPMRSMLYAVEVPPYGGDPLFANQYLAFEALSAGMRELLGRLSCVCDSRAASAVTREDRQRQVGSAQKVLTAVHPVVRTHPETGRRSLYVNYGHTVRFDGWTAAESRHLLDFLFVHQTRPEFTCRFTWSPRALAFWDNRCTQHNPVNDYQGLRRVMHRVTLEGDRPR